MASWALTRALTWRPAITGRVIAANGIRLVLDEHRSTATPTLKSGQPGKTKVMYGGVEQATTWLWKFVDGAKTAGELCGRTMVVFAAQHYASQLALPASQRRPSVLPFSRKDAAGKAFEKVAKTAPPASYGELARAIEREARSYRTRQAKPSPSTPGRRRTPPATTPTSRSRKRRSTPPRTSRTSRSRRRRSTPHKRTARVRRRGAGGAIKASALPDGGDGRCTPGGA